MAWFRTARANVGGWRLVAAGGVAGVGAAAAAAEAVAKLPVATPEEHEGAIGQRLLSLASLSVRCFGEVSQSLGEHWCKPAVCETGATVEPYLDSPLSADLAQRVENQTDYQARMEDMVLRAQASIVRALSTIDDGAQFRVDRHERPNGEGGGITTVLQDSKVFEKAGVNVSVIRGDLKPALAAQMSSRGKDLGPGPHRFFASGISSVVHPRNPMVPTMHFNYRYFECIASNGKRTWWYGGGTDLTPYFLIDGDVEHFHNTLKRGCDQYDLGYYPRFKKWCDEYFYIKHRKETRGVGGIFFDDLDNKPQEELFQYVRNMAATVLPAYLPLVEARKDAPYTESDREWQLLRRGRYVEFNLVYDRGTKFGLVTPQARIESIFISLPLTARWEYRHEPQPGTPEHALTEVLQCPREWATD